MEDKEQELVNIIDDIIPDETLAPFCIPPCPYNVRYCIRPYLVPSIEPYAVMDCRGNIFQYTPQALEDEDPDYNGDSDSEMSLTDSEYESYMDEKYGKPKQ